MAAPLGDNEQYDLLLSAGVNRIYKVQVKASTNRHGECYTFQLRRGATKVRYEDVDVFACYLVPERLFFILPNGEVGDRRTVKLNPVPRRSQWAVYRENWGVFEQQLSGLQKV